MWKWLGGCLVVVVVLFVFLFWWSLRTIRNSTEPDGSVAVMIGAPPERVFASMSSGDSISTWMAQGNTVIATRRDRLQPGDMIRIRFQGMPRDAMSWQVAEVVPNVKLVLQLSDSTGRALATRRDSLSAHGDSTRVSSRLVSPMLENPASLDTSAAGSDALFDMTSNLVFSMFRMQSKMELTRLKERIEGNSR
jgi:uncharacterized protein YndB with AHSA1/START domain